MKKDVVNKKAICIKECYHSFTQLREFDPSFTQFEKFFFLRIYDVQFYTVGRINVARLYNANDNVTYRLFTQARFSEHFRIVEEQHV